MYKKKEVREKKTTKIKGEVTRGHYQGSIILNTSVRVVLSPGRERETSINKLNLQEFCPFGREIRRVINSFLRFNVRRNDINLTRNFSGKIYPETNLFFYLITKFSYIRV